MRTILGTEPFNEKTVISIEIGYGVAGQKVDIPDGDEKATLKGAIDFVQNAGGKNFRLRFSDSTEKLWRWNRDKQAFIAE